MKLLRYVGFAVLALVSIAGGLMSCEVIPKRQFEALSQWLQATLFVCFTICAIGVIWGFIGDYRQIRRARRAGHK